MSIEFKSLLIGSSLLLVLTIFYVSVGSRHSIANCKAKVEAMGTLVDEIRKEKKTDMELSDAMTKSALRSVLYDKSLNEKQKIARIKEYFAL